MEYKYSFHNSIDLFVSGRISKTDAARQTRTSKAILKRFESQPGVVLADEVGMGKTFVALSIAASISLQNREYKPIVVMVPSSLQKKWPRDFNLFKEKCVKGTKKLNYGVATKASNFLKFLDDPPERQKQIIFLTHGAMSRGLTDSWIKLALIKRALYKRKNTQELKKALYKYIGKLLYLGWAEKNHPEIWKVLLNAPTSKWLKELQKRNIDPEHDNDPLTDDDPVPEAIVNVLDNFNFNEIYQALKGIPRKQSKHFDQRLKETRRVINQTTKEVWDQCIKSLELSFPLLILDEAHHLKNSHTRLASLFHTNEAESDVEEIYKGPLAGVFERMLFLTATPFQLGHHELCSVLERFKGIKWDDIREPKGGLTKYTALLKQLSDQLDVSQRCARLFEESWSKLKPEDIYPSYEKIEDMDDWWDTILSEEEPLALKFSEVKRRYFQTSSKFCEVEKLLRKLVIRHIKPKELTGKYKGNPRRRTLIGNDIIDEDIVGNTTGLTIKGEAIVPFLLSARASVKQIDQRPLFAEGLSSSYEAFIKTRVENIKKQIDTDQDIEEDFFKIEDWHYQQLWKSLDELILDSERINHPKIKATVNKTLDLWMQGEKVLVFCHFIATGKALRQYISEAMIDEVKKAGYKKLNCKKDEVLNRLENLGQRFAKDDSSFRRSYEKEILNILGYYPLLAPFSDELLVVILRYLRTPTFLVRFFPLNESRYTSSTFKKALNKKDKSGLTLKTLIRDFFEFLEAKCSKEERKEYIKALTSIQTGRIAGDDVQEMFSEDEIQGDPKERLLPNVRLVNGTTKQETRQKLMLTFNTPFYPDILIASSVMAEGVDLHMNCRYIIHHDLCWNPSTLEQRTGRVDRIGAKVEKCGEAINIYLPYISETQDEKMYRVVMDRERWFKIIMGDKFKVDVKTTDELAERISIPSKIVEDLNFNLEV